MSDSPGSFGPFDLLVRLGQGGMGEVWKARRRDAGEDAPFVVVKRVLAHLSSDDDIAHMFQREARLLARLDHPNIVRVLDSGAVGRELYLEMEFVHGVDVIQLMRRFKHTGVPPGAAAYTVAAVARALGHAHALLDERRGPLRLVHRDVTPSNVMIAFDGQVKLLDFGIAKALSEASESRTTTGTLKGKFGYMAPEQIEGAAATHATDQFSLGVVLHEMLTGRRLFRGESDMQTLARARAALVDPPSHSNIEVTEELDAICLRALARRPAQRFADCTALADALDAVAARLGWSAAQNAALVAPIVPAHADGALVLALDSAPRDTVRALAPTSSTRRRPWRATAVGAALAFAAGVALILHRPAPKVVAPTPVVAAPAPAVVAPARADPPPASLAPTTVVRLGGSRITHVKTARARPARASAPGPAKAPPTTAPATAGKVRAGQVLDPFAR